jgi:hypothetical protein
MDSPPVLHRRSVIVLSLVLVALGAFWLLRKRGPETLSDLGDVPAPPPTLARPMEDPLSPLKPQINGQQRAWAGRPMDLGRNMAAELGGLSAFRWSKLAGPGNVAFRPPDELATTATFSEPGTYLLRLTAKESGDSPTERDVAVEVARAPIDAWKQAHFGLAAMTNKKAGDHADPDGDGMSNLMEYALMLNPNKTDVTGLPDPSLRNGTLSMIYKRPASAIDVAYQVQWTEDMLTWHSDDVTEHIVMKVGDMQIIRATAPGSKGRASRFLRLRLIGP